MKLFITGSSGFIGKELVKSLSPKHDIVTYDKTQKQDILDYAQLKKAMQGCETVIHLAAIPKPDESKSFEEYFKINDQGTFNVAKAAMENKVKRFIFISSTTYYGIEKGIPFVKPIKEENQIITQHLKTDDLSCRDCDLAYSTSKVIAEQILANYGMTKKFEVIILRIGPTRQKGEYRPFLGMHLKIENAIQAIQKAIQTKKKMLYEAFTITDACKDVDLSKAKKMLGYKAE